MKHHIRTERDAQKALFGGVRCTLSEWCGLPESTRELFTEAGAQIFQSFQLMLFHIYNNKETAEDLLLGSSGRIQRTLLAGVRKSLGR